MSQTFKFLCGNFGNKKFIYATKFGQHHWHYFNDKHTIITEHDSLPSELEEVITTFKKVRTVSILLDEEQVKRYYDNEKFIFKNTELKTCMKSPNPPTTRNVKTTRHLVFNSLETNPLLFLAKFEECSDLKTDRDKLWKIRDFVDQKHKAEFSQLRLAGDWSTAKRVFAEKYLVTFIENKKKEINIDFYQASSLRQFVEQKISSLEKYTTLPFINQMEIILNELPLEIAYLLMVNEMFYRNKYEILDFCDSVQEVCENYRKDRNIQPSNHMEIDNQDDSDIGISTLREESSSSRRGRGSRGRGCTREETNKCDETSISEDEISGDTLKYAFVDTMSNSSRSTWSSLDNSLPSWSAQKN